MSTITSYNLMQPLFVRLVSLASKVSTLPFLWTLAHSVHMEAHGKSLEQLSSTSPP